MKDENIDPSNWSDESTTLGHARDFKFLKPVNLPGLASTRAKKVECAAYCLVFIYNI
jgi:hypothetical protein